MKLLHYMVLRQFLAVFFITMLFIVLLIILVDFFANIWRYMNQGVSLSGILSISYYFIPKAISYAIPISILFAASYTMGELYASNQLISIFGSGISLFWFTYPLIIFGLLTSLFSFFFEDSVVIPTFEMKNSLIRKFQNTSSYSDTDVVILSENNRVVYVANYFSAEDEVLSGNIIIIIKDEEGKIETRIDANRGTWVEGVFEIENARVTDFTGEEVSEFIVKAFRDPLLNEPPQTFRRMIKSIDELSLVEAKEWIELLKRSGRPYKKELTEYYQRFSFPFTSFIVVMISCAVGGRFKKNILLMSLLISVSIAVSFYVLQNTMGLLAKGDTVRPIIGAWLPLIFYTGLGGYLFRKAVS